MREHLLLGSAEHNTLRTGCGKTPRKDSIPPYGDSYSVGASGAFPEAEYIRLRRIAMMHMCGICERSWRKICRARHETFEPTARDAEAT